jgi:hypothetical protein
LETGKDYFCNLQVCLSLKFEERIFEVGMGRLGSTVPVHRFLPGRGRSPVRQGNHALHALGHRRTVRSAPPCVDRSPTTCAPRSTAPRVSPSYARAVQCQAKFTFSSHCSCVKLAIALLLELHRSATTPRRGTVAAALCAVLKLSSFSSAQSPSRPLRSHCTARLPPP